MKASCRILGLKRRCGQRWRMPTRTVRGSCSRKCSTNSTRRWPRASVVPSFKTEMDQSAPCLTNVLGVKGVGELGTIGATPSIVNAVADALARAGRKELAPKLQMPLTPSRVWELMHA